MNVLTRALFALILGAGLLVGTTGCDNTNDENPALLRVIHATPGLDAIDFLIDFELFTRNLAFRSASPYNRWDSGLRRLEARTAQNDPLITQDTVLDPDTVYTTLVVGTPVAPTLFVLQDNRSTPPAGQARLRVVHAAPNLGSLNVAVNVTNGGNTLDVPLSGFRRTSPFISILADTYDIVARATDGSGGPPPLMQPLESGRRYLIVVTNTSVFTVADG